MTKNTQDPVEVLHQPDEARFVICVDGRLAGKAEYVQLDEQRVFVHTEVDAEFAGQGLAVKLVNKALTNTVNSGMRIVPVCPFVVAFTKRNHDFDSSIDAATPELFEQLKVSK